MSNKIIQEGKDALSRSLLLMNYSNKQTLSENVAKVSKIEEQSFNLSFLDYRSFAILIIQLCDINYSTKFDLIRFAVAFN